MGLAADPCSEVSNDYGETELIFANLINKG